MINTNSGFTEEELKKLPTQNHFYLRGLETTRLETFTDAAFAFAITMLVISVGDIPHTYSELVLALKGTPAFLASFTAILLFWSGHRKWSRRFGLEDGRSIILSFALIFVMLVYVYPLRLLFSALFSWITAGWAPSEFILTNANELVGLFVIYGVGFAAMAFTLLLLYLHAKSLRNILYLNELEILIIEAEMKVWFTMGITGLISALFAIIFPARIAVWAGFVYTTLPVTMPMISIRSAKKIKNFKP